MQAASVDLRIPDFRVDVEHCIRCSQHSTFTRHDEHKYLAAYKRIENEIGKNFPSSEIVANPIPASLKPLEIPDMKTQDQEIYVNKDTQERVRYPRLGSFEVTVVFASRRKKLLGSKLLSGRFPGGAEIIAALEAAIQEEKDTCSGKGRLTSRPGRSSRQRPSSASPAYLEGVTRMAAPPPLRRPVNHRPVSAAHSRMAAKLREQRPLSAPPKRTAAAPDGKYLKGKNSAKGNVLPGIPKTKKKGRVKDMERVVIHARNSIQTQKEAWTHGTGAHGGIPKPSGGLRTYKDVAFVFPGENSRYEGGGKRGAIGRPQWSEGDAVVEDFQVDHIAHLTGIHLRLLFVREFFALTSPTTGLPLAFDIPFFVELNGTPIGSFSLRSTSNPVKDRRERTGATIDVDIRLPRSVRIPSVIMKSHEAKEAIRTRILQLRVAAERSVPPGCGFYIIEEGGEVTFRGYKKASDETVGYASSEGAPEPAEGTSGPIDIASDAAGDFVRVEVEPAKEKVMKRPMSSQPRPSHKAPRHPRPQSAMAVRRVEEKPTITVEDYLNSEGEYTEDESEHVRSIGNDEEKEAYGLDAFDEDEEEETSVNSSPLPNAADTSKVEEGRLEGQTMLEARQGLDAEEEPREEVIETPAITTGSPAASSASSESGAEEASVRSPSPVPTPTTTPATPREGITRDQESTAPAEKDVCDVKESSEEGSCHPSSAEGRPSQSSEDQKESEEIAGEAEVENKREASINKEETTSQPSHRSDDPIKTSREASPELSAPSNEAEKRRVSFSETVEINMRSPRADEHYAQLPDWQSAPPSEDEDDILVEDEEEDEEESKTSSEGSEGEVSESDEEFARALADEVEDDDEEEDVNEHKDEVTGDHQLGRQRYKNDQKQHVSSPSTRENSVSSALFTSSEIEGGGSERENGSVAKSNDDRSVSASLAEKAAIPEWTSREESEVMHDLQPPSRPASAAASDSNVSDVWSAVMRDDASSEATESRPSSALVGSARGSTSVQLAALEEVSGTESSQSDYTYLVMTASSASIVAGNNEVESSRDNLVMAAVDAAKNSEDESDEEDDELKGETSVSHTSDPDSVTLEETAEETVEETVGEETLEGNDAEIDGEVKSRHIRDEGTAEESVEETEETVDKMLGEENHNDASADTESLGRKCSHPDVTSTEEAGEETAEETVEDTLEEVTVDETEDVNDAEAEAKTESQHSKEARSDATPSEERPERAKNTTEKQALEKVSANKTECVNDAEAEVEAEAKAKSIDSKESDILTTEESAEKGDEAMKKENTELMIVTSDNISRSSEERQQSPAVEGDGNHDTILKINPNQVERNRSSLLGEVRSDEKIDAATGIAAETGSDADRPQAKVSLKHDGGTSRRNSEARPVEDQTSENSSRKAATVAMPATEATTLEEKLESSARVAGSDAMLDAVVTAGVDSGRKDVSESQRSNSPQISTAESSEIAGGGQAGDINNSNESEEKSDGDLFLSEEEEEEEGTEESSGHLSGSELTYETIEETVDEMSSKAGSSLHQPSAKYSLAQETSSDFEKLFDEEVSDEDE